MPFGSVAKSWRRLLIDVAFGRNYPAYFSMSSATVRGAPRNPILDELLPSLLQIKAVAVLDKALRVKLDSDGTTPKAHGFRNDLNGRIETALAVGILKDVSLLHRVRGSRNDVAHEFDEKIDWKQLDRDISTIHLALHEMGAVGSLPVLDVKWERVPKTVLKDPKAALGFDYSIAVVEGDTVWAEMEWSEEILGIGE